MSAFREVIGFRLCFLGGLLHFSFVPMCLSFSKCIRDCNE